MTDSWHSTLQACANIMTETCITSDGQSGSAMWDTDYKIRGIVTGKVCPTLTGLPPCLKSFQQTQSSPQEVSHFR